MGEDWAVRTLLAGMAGRNGHPAVVALSDAERECCSYAELARRAQALASGLRAAGAQPGERAVLIGPNGIDWITVYLGLMAAGLIAVPLDHLSQAGEIERIVQAAPPRWVFASADHLDALRRIVPSVCIRLIGSDEGAGVADWRTLLAADPAELPEVDATAPAVLLQTSGTTGPPKLFYLTARHLGANVVPLAAAGLAKSDDRLVLPLPLHHIYPQVIGLLTALTVGATIVLPAAVTGPALVSALRAERATGVIGVPRLYEALLEGLEDAIGRRSRLVRKLYGLALSAATAARRRFGWSIGGVLFGRVRRRLSPDLRLLVSGGARLDPAVAWRLAALGFDVRSGYGLAETASTHTANVPGRDRIGSEGQPFQGGEVRIDEPDADGIGEVLLRGPNVFDGYLDAERTGEAFTADGWFRTGDLGRLDAGFLTVTGRVKETIVLGGGKKVSPEDLEKLYARSPFIAELAILESAGRLVGLVRVDAAAVAAEGFTHADGTVRVALADAARTLPSYQHLAGFALVREPLPRTRLGKVRRFLLPELYRRARAGIATAPARPVAAPEALIREPRAAAAWRLLQERYATRLTGVDDFLALDLGVDSLEWINLSLELERRLGIDLTATSLGGIVSVRGLLDAVGRAPAGARIAPAEAGPWLRPAPPWQRAVARLLRALNRLLVRALFQLRVDGLEHLPRRGPFVIACNHLSYLDAFVIAAALPSDVLRQAHWGAAERTLPAPTRLRWLYVALNIFPLEEAASAIGLAGARRALDGGEVMVLFPEAWRSPDGRLQPFLPGIGHIVAGTDIPIVPARLDGTFEALPRYRRWPRLVPLRLRFGPPLSPTELATRGQGETPAQRIADGLHRAVAALEAGSGESKDD
ncbi:MAG: AMP-binding protein [Alphaproteobacteria bacterium]